MPKQIYLTIKRSTTVRLSYLKSGLEKSSTQLYGKSRFSCWASIFTFSFAQWPKIQANHLNLNHKVRKSWRFLSAGQTEIQFFHFSTPVRFFFLIMLSSSYKITYFNFNSSCVSSLPHRRFFARPPESLLKKYGQKLKWSFIEW